MKIAHVVCVFPPYKGGIGNSALSFASLVKDKYDVTVFTPAFDDKKIKLNGLRAEYLKPFLKFGKGALLLQLFYKLRKFDIVHLHYPFFGGAEIVWLSKVFGGKFKLAIHYHMDTGELSPLAKILSLPSRIIQKSLFEKADIISCASLDYIKNSSIKKYYEKNENKFHEIPFAVDTKKFFYSPKDFFKEEKTILFVAGLDKAHYFKGLEVLLKAVKELETKNWKLNIIGDGDLKESYIKKSKDLGIKEKVDFLGRVSDKDLPNEYQKADIFVLPSINSHEAFGIVLIESMASGTPVIASNLPGVRSVFTDGDQGFLAVPGNTKDLTDKIDEIIDNNEARERMSDASLELISDKYTLEKIKVRLSNFYKIL